MSRSSFLEMTDENFWGNVDSDEEKIFPLPPPAKEPSLPQAGDWKKPTVAPIKKKCFSRNHFHLPSERSGGFGGFDRTNAGDYNLKKKSFDLKKMFRLVTDEFNSTATAMAPILSQRYILSPAQLEISRRITASLKKMNQLDISANSPCRDPCDALNPIWYEAYSPRREIFSRKLFMGGLPADVKEEDLFEIFREFGPLKIDWPSKEIKGYAFLIYESEESVKLLMQYCQHDEDKTYIEYLHSERLIKIQIRPWRIADSDYLVHESSRLNSKHVIFIGGVPRPIRACELAHIIEQLYGSVLAVGLDVDVENKYPKGAARVVFEHWSSYRRAIGDKYALLLHGEIEKRVEMKPYVLDDMPCEECSLKIAPFFCFHKDCLQYYCEDCWTKMHNRPGRGDHMSLVKDI